MYIQTKNSYDEMSYTAAVAIAQYIRKKPDSLLCLAAGDTPTGIYRELVRMQKENEIDISQCHFIGLDEWVGLSREDNGSCTEYMYSHVFEPLHVKSDNIFFFNAKAENLVKECERANEFLRLNGNIDISVMGVGMNGHIGLNEPGTSFDSNAHITLLSKTTTNVAQKYFTETTFLEKGITLGLGQILASDYLIVVAAEEKKAEIMRKAIEEEMTTDVPASFLQMHKNCEVFLDAGAASKLGKV